MYLLVILGMNLTLHGGFRGVCISDMVPFYLGMAFRQTGAPDDVCSKVCSLHKVLKPS